jgi:NADH-quinone oxidoreductase subunit N
MEYALLALASLILLTLGAALSLKTSKGVLIACIIALLLMLSAPSNSYLAYALFVFIIAFLNLISLNVMKARQIAGVDYSLVALMALATIYVLYTQDLALVLATFILVSVPTYILVMVGDRSTNVNIGIKYITFMVLATILFILGAIILIFTYYEPNDYLYIIGYTLLLLGLCLEVGVAPLHEWVPDVFSAANPIPVSIIASLAKIVPIVVAYKILITTANPLIVSISLLTAFLAVVSMLMGNIGALTAKELSRVLGYSTVANMGYILATLVVLINIKFIYLAFAGAFLQLIVNSVGKIGFFSSIKGEGCSTPLMYLLALSFIGLPPLMGFWSKLFIVLALVGVGYLWLAIVLVINSAISIPYYLRLARELGRRWTFNLVNAIALIAVAITLITIVPPDWFLGVISDLFDYLQLSMGG